MMRRTLLVAWAAACAYAHVGSPDVFLEGSAGPYPMYVTIRPPSVIPGVAEIEIRCASQDIQAIHVTPTPLTGAAAKFAPTPDAMQRSKADAQFFTGTLWMMEPGSWQVRIQADGAKGAGQLSVPVPAVATRAKPMQFALGVTLFAMMMVLAVGLVSIVGAGVREGQLEPGMQATTRSKRRARVLMGTTATLVILILWAGDRWWTAEASDFAGSLYRPLQMTASIVNASTAPNDRLVLTLANPAWSVPRKIDDFLPDHGHLMHLYMIRQPDAARVWHLHPEMTASGVFTLALPPISAGQYQLYGDVVHRDGLAETMVASLTVPQDLAGTPVGGDDAAGVRGESPDGAHIVWDRDAAPLKARKASIFKFRLVDRDGAPVQDAELYMGMLGHAAFLKDDGTAFAHVHPSGSVPMAALALANPTPGEDHSLHHMSGLPPEADFPYGFPTPGDYRVIVQMKHRGVIETGIFDAKVD
jgi:hypothetical protein